MSKWYVSVLILVLAACTGPDADSVLRINRGATQGTTYSISYRVEAGVDYQSAIDSILFAIDRSLSAWNQYSTLSRVNKGEIDSVNDPLFTAVVRRGLVISAETDGYFDMTIAPLVDAWGFGADGRESLDSSRVDTLLLQTGYRRLILQPSGRILKASGMRIDVNAIAQGYSVDVIAEWFNKRGVSDYLIEVGGEMRARGVNLKGEPWVVGIDKPSEEIQEQRFQVIIGLDSTSLATSGNYRKFFVDETTGVKYAHTIDPHTGYPVRHRLLSVSVLADDCMSADAYATACMAMGLDKARAFIEGLDGVEAYFVYSGLTGEWETWSTAGFQEVVK